MEEINKYTIRKGNHYSGIRFRPVLIPRQCSFEFMFTDKSKYVSEPNTQLREQWNKLAGFSLDLIGSNSIRFGWRYNSDKGFFEVCEYKHVESKIIVGDIFIAPKDVVHKAVLGGIGIIGYRQYPYFGGKAPAPEDISVYVKFL